MTRLFTFLIVLFLHIYSYANVGFECFYPVNAEYFAFVNELGNTRMFQRTVLDQSSLVGEGGWYGKLQGRNAVLMSPGVRGQRREFREGLPVGLDADLKTPKGKNRSGATLSSLFPSQKDIDVAIETARKDDIWGKDDRFRFIFKNPNVEAACLAPIFLAFFLLGIRIKKLWIKVIFILFAAGLGYLLYRTESRGAFVATVVPLAFLFVAQLRRLCTWRMVIISVALLGGIAYAICFTHVADRFTRDLFARDASNNLRVEILRAVPDMVKDSPSGVGVGNSGATYLTWYRLEDKSRMLRTLVSSHLTWFVEFGHIGRCAYLFAWFALLLFLATMAVKGMSPIPFCAWLSLFLVGIFNPVLEVWQVWIPSVAALGFLFTGKRWISLKVTAILSVVAFCASLTVLLLVIHNATRDNDEPELQVSGTVVKIGCGEPSSWIVGDNLVVGGWMFVGQEIQQYFAENSVTSAIAYVESLDALPSHADRLVLTGHFAEDYLKRWRDGKRKESLCRADSLLLISPSVPATEFSSSMAKSGHVRAVIGSLTTPLSTSYSTGSIPPWIRVVKGALLYIPGWVGLALDF